MHAKEVVKFAQILDRKLLLQSLNGAPE